MNVYEALKYDQEKKKAEQVLLLEYLLDPFMTYDEAVKLSRLAHPHPLASYPNDRPVNPSNLVVAGI